MKNSVILQLIFLFIMLGLSFYLTKIQVKSPTRQLASTPEISPEPSLDFPMIKSFLEENKGIELADFIATLPEDYKQNYTLLHHSFSLQGSSYQSPRVLMFGKDASTVITFTGNNEQRFGDAVEILYFNPESNEFELYHIKFPLAADEKFEKNPAKCLSCHSSRPKPYGEVKPIWEVYPRWPGAYGSFNDHLFLRKDPNKKDSIREYEWNELIQEGEEFFKFKDYAQTHPRYRHLVFKQDRSYFPYRDKRAGEAYNRLDERPNFMLGVLLMGHNVRKLARLMEQTDVYQKFKYSLLTERLNCNVGISFRHLQFIRLNLNPYLEQVYPRVTGKYRDLFKVLHKFNPQNGIPPFLYHWNIDFEETPDSYFNGFAKAEEFFILNTVLLTNLAKSDARLARYIVSQSWIRNLPSFYRGTNSKPIIDKVTPSHDYNAFKRSGGCNYLAEKSQAEIDQFKNDEQKFESLELGEISPAYYLLFADPKKQLEKITKRSIDATEFESLYRQKAPDKVFHAYKKNTDPRLEVRYGCMDCHAGSEKFGPHLGLFNRTNYDFLNQTLNKNIAKPFAMPLGRVPLTQQEQTEFKLYLENFDQLND